MEGYRGMGGGGNRRGGDIGLEGGFGRAGYMGGDGLCKGRWSGKGRG